MLTAAVWNMRGDSKNFDRLYELMDNHPVDVALLNEAPVPVPHPEGFVARFSESGTVGRERRRDDKPCRRPWSAAIVAAGGQLGEVEAVAASAWNRRPDVPFEPSRSGTWIAGTVEAPDIGRVALVSLYGLMDELSDASLHRSLSDVSPVFTDPDYKKFVLVGGDLNASTQWTNANSRARDGNLLERFEAYGLVDCLRKMSPGPLEGCTCSLGEDCRHSWTRFDPKHPKLQVDYLFASAPLAKRLKSCEALSPQEWREHSDHSPIIASFE